MSVQRIIPVLLHKHGRFVLSRSFTFHHNIGSTKEISDRLKSWDLDELIIIDISAHWPDLNSQNHDREQLFNNFCTAIDEISQNCFVPLSVGGGIESLEHVHKLMHVGADRVIINSAAYKTPDLITAIAESYGSQAVIIGVDVKNDKNNQYALYSSGGKICIDMSLDAWIAQVEELGAGEIFIQSIDTDGTGNGYDNKLLETALGTSHIPLVFCGGAGNANDIFNALKSGAKAAAAANIFNFFELSYKNLKDDVEKSGIKLRPSNISIDYVSDKKPQKKISQFNADSAKIWQELAEIGFME